MATSPETPEKKEWKPGCGTFLICQIIGMIIAINAYPIQMAPEGFSDSVKNWYYMGELAAAFGGGLVPAGIFYVIILAIAGSVNRHRK
ncbi:MAG: DUF5321 domain-containing protein [Deltaproteobacteria bacterium]|jgi:hypothetical protein|nr:DUF5321 domain-containing protein [Deltaproteobacteria bacterium]